MHTLGKLRLFLRQFFLALPLLLTVLALGGCQKFRQTDMTPLNQAGMSFSSVEELRHLQVTDAEAQQLALAHQAGISDEGCVELIRIIHGRQETFGNGQDMAGLVRAGFAEDSILTLVRLNQLGLWTGEAQAMRLANLSDEVILSVARRRAAGQTVLSSSKVADLRNAGLTEKEIIEQIQRGATDAEAEAIIARRRYLSGGHGFVRQSGRRR